jgi:hypothetical protein
MGAVVAMSVGLCAMASTWIRSRTWSNAMMIMTTPLVKSILSIRFIVCQNCGQLISFPSLNFWAISSRIVLLEASGT